MTGRLWLIAGVAVVLLNGAGCVCCGHKGYGIARTAAPECGLADCQRNRVYVFAVGGLTPPSAHALDALRGQLNENGFAKVGTAPWTHHTWAAGEMRDIHRNEPGAVFVLVGCGGGGPTAARLAERAAADGLPVAAVVLIDPDGRTPPRGGVRTLAIGGYGPGASAGLTSLPAPGVCCNALVTDPQTVAALVSLLNDVAAGVPFDPPEDGPLWEYEHATPARPVVEPGDAAGEWGFLFDLPGGPRAITDPTPAAGRVTPANPTPSVWK